MSSMTMISLLEKINAQDKDFRYMATSDLATELQKDQFRVDSEVERKLCSAIVARLDDSSGDVSSLAVKCLGLLVGKVTEPRAQELVSQLCDKVITPVSDKEEQRVVATIALKNVIHVVQGTPIAATLAPLITNKMLQGMTKDNAEVVSDSIEVLGELADKIGPGLASEHQRIRDALLPYLNDSRAQVRRRVLHTLTAISIYMSDDLLSGTVTALLERVKKGDLKPDLLRIYIQALGHISRAVGYRFGKHINDAVTLAIQYCQKAGENDDDLREYCLQALEGFVTHVPIDARGQLESILTLSLANLRYDPNYTDDNDDMEEDQDGDEDNEDDEDQDDEGYSDDEDMSWKVRRAAVKTLNALVATYADALPQLYEAAAEKLVQRFQEREESVRGDVFGAYITLARQVGAVSGRYVQDDPNSPVTRLASHVPGVVKAITKQLKQRSLKARVGSLQLLRELALVLPAAVAAQFNMVVPGIVLALGDKSSASSALKIEALLFTRAALAAGPQGSAADIPQLKQLITAVLACANDKYYKVAAEAVRVLDQVIMVLRPLPNSGNAPASLTGIPVDKIYQVLQARLTAPDQDQEVKEAAISATATLGARCGDVLTKEVPTMLKTLLDRLRNEITRLPAVRGFNTLADSPLPLDFSSVLEPMVQELTSFLRKALRPLRLAALLALESICGKYGSSLPGAVLASVTEEASQLIVDSDLALAAQALRTLSVLLRVQPAAAGPAIAKALPASLELIRSPLLQGGALDQLKLFLTALAASGQPGATTDELMSQLLATGRGVGSQARGTPLAVAQCVAVLASAAGPSKVADTAKALLADVSSSDTATHRLALLCLGELGRRADLSSLPQVMEAVQKSLFSDGEEIKTAASQALGGVACGNLNKYMPSLIKLISEASNPRQQYLLLGALNEVLTTVSIPPMPQTQGVPPAVQPQIAPGDQAAVLSLLLGMIDSAQEECKALIAECLGKLALLQPQQVLSELQKHLSDSSINMRAVVVSSLRYMVTERPHPVDTPLAAAVGPFLALVSDAHHTVRRAAVVALAAIAHQKPALVTSGRDGAPPPLVALLGPLYKQGVELPELIRTVDLGPFKHKIDDGLELRKALFECLDILLDSPSCSSLLDMPAFVQTLQLGLKDHADIKAQCHLILAKLASAAPVAVLSGAEGLVTQLEATITPSMQYLKKSDTVKQELDRHNDTLRSCLRAVHAMAQLPGVETCAPFQTFLKRQLAEPIVRTKYNEVAKEWSDANADRMDLS